MGALFTPARSGIILDAHQPMNGERKHGMYSQQSRGSGSTGQADELSMLLWTSGRTGAHEI